MPVRLPPTAQTSGAWRSAGIFAGTALLAIGLVALILFFPIWLWYWWRIEPANGQMAVLVRKTGENLAANEILATRPGQKGIQLEVLGEGRYFRNPYTWDWHIHPITDIPAGKLGVLVRLYGKDLPPGEIIAGKDTRGIEAEVLRPGKYRINPFANQICVFDAKQIRPGHVGVQTRLVGKDVFDGSLPESERNKYLVSGDNKGVGAVALDPGTYYLNPYIWSVDEINLQSQRFEMGGSDAVVFLSSDGFVMRAEGTIEYSIQRDHAALLLHQVGDLEDIVKKLILPRARGFSRIEGSKKSAVEFIVGETRQAFQNNLEKHLKDNCQPLGVSIHSVLVRNIIAPNEISTIIRDRELASQEARKLEQQLEQAKSKAELVRQQMLAEQNSRKVEADTAKLRAEISARQDQAVRLTAAQRELEVTRIDKDTAEAQAKALLTAAEAERDVIRLNNEAEAAVLGGKAAAFGGGLGWAQYNLYTKLAPRIQGIMTTDEAAGAILPIGPRPVPVTSSGKEATR